MKKDKKKILIITLCALLAVALIVILAICLKSGKKSTIEDTKWISVDDASILTLTKSGEEGSYDWTQGDDSRKGTFIVYTGKKAEARLDEYAQAYIEAEYNDVPEGEKFGFEDETEKFKEELQKDNTFLLEETDISVNDGEPGAKELPYRNIYFGTTEKIKTDDGSEQEYLTLINIRTYFPHTFIPYSEEKLKEIQESRERSFKNLNTLDDDGKDKNFGVKSYVVPDGYKKWGSEKDYIAFVRSDSPSNEIVVNVMKETPLYGIADGFPEKEEKTLGNVKGYLAREEYGPRYKYFFLFENDGTTYMIEANEEKALTDLVSSIEL